MGAVRTRNEQRPIPAGLRSPRVQSHKADSVFLLAVFSWVDPAVQRLLHHPKVEPTLTGSCPCPCSGDTSPLLRGVCCCCCCCCCSPFTPIANNLVKIALCVLLPQPFPGVRQQPRDSHSNPVKYRTKATKRNHI